MKRQMTALALIIAALLQTNPTYAEIQSNTAGFKDTEKHWGKTYIEKLQKEGYAVGSNGYFKPNEALKTEDFLIMALKVVDPSAKDLTAAQGQKYYEPFMARAAEVGLIRNEYDEVPQYVERMMPRELAVQVIDRALTKMGQNIEADQGLSYRFKDFEIVNDINRDPVLRAYELGIIKGSNGNFEPKNSLTRADAAVLIAKLMDKNLRDNVSVSRNPKTYDEISQWYIDTFEKTVDKRSVLIEKKAGGVLNSGDVDYTERAFYYQGKWNNWWTDREYEDEILGNISNRKMVEYSSAIFGSEMKQLNYYQGSYYVRNGEIIYTEFDGDKGKAYKNHSHPIPNSNRVFYDLMKYSSQYAKLAEKHATVIVGKGGQSISFCEDVYNYNYTQLVFEFPSEPEVKKIYWTENKFLPMLNIRLNNDFYGDYKPMTQQMLVRIYGEKTGVALTKEIEKWIKGRGVESYGYKDMVINGVSVRFADPDYINPQVTIGFPK